MKQKAARTVSAFTLIEMLAVIAIVMVLAAVLLPSLHRRHGPKPSDCISNLKEIGTAYHLWAGDNGDLVPSQQSVSNGGWKEPLTNADQGAICWTNYALMAYELAQSPKLVLCPDDERLPALTFSNNFDNTHLSYFVGVSANATYPQSIEGGDRNLGPGAKPGPNYGFSPQSGKGNDVAIPTNSLAGLVSWSLKMHSAGNAGDLGNILLGDCSVQQVSSATFRQNWLSHADPTTNWPAGHVPASPSIRLVFP